MERKLAFKVGAFLMACVVFGMGPILSSDTIAGQELDFEKSPRGHNLSSEAGLRSSREVGATEGNVNRLTGWPYILERSHPRERHFSLFHQLDKVADVRVMSNGQINFSMQFSTGIIEAGSLDDERMFIAVIPLDSESVYVEFPVSKVHALADRSGVSKALSREQLWKLEEALTALNLDLKAVKIDDLQIRHAGLSAGFLGKEPSFAIQSSSCNESACLFAILAMDVAVIGAVLVCAGSFGLGCLGGLGAVAAAASAVALACDGCGG